MFSLAVQPSRFLTYQLVLFPYLADCISKPACLASYLINITVCLQVTGFGYEHDEPWAANMELFKEVLHRSAVTAWATACAPVRIPE